MKLPLRFPAIVTFVAFLFLSLPSFSQLSCVDSALDFNGNNQYVKMAPNDTASGNFLSKLTGDYTIECLLKWNAPSDWERVFDFSYGENYFMFLTTSENTNHVPRFAISVNGLGNYEYLDARDTFVRNVYHHIAITFSKSKSLVTMFVDGVNEGSGTIDIAADSIYRGSDAHDSSVNYIAKSSFLNDPSLNGDIDEFRVSDTVRYVDNFTPAVPFTPDSNTILLYHFNDGSGQKAWDASHNGYIGVLGETAEAGADDPSWISCSNVLASSLINFTATNVKGQVQLNWNTVSEINSSYYEIQKSTDGVHFTTAGKVNAIGSSTNNNYSFTDISPAPGNNYYRLKQVDVNGSFTYSKALFINVNGSGGFKVYPTITSNHLHISVTQTPSTLVIYNAVGKPVQTISVNNADEDINVSGLSTGSYIIRNITTNSSLKFIKQ